MGLKSSPLATSLASHNFVHQAMLEGFLATEVITNKFKKRRRLPKRLWPRINRA